MTQGQKKVKRYLDGMSNGADDAAKIRSLGKMVGVLNSQGHKAATVAATDALSALVHGKDAAKKVRAACTEIAKTLPNE